METLPIIEYTPLGITALALFVILVMVRKQKNGIGNGFNKEILKELQEMNNNHLDSLNKTIEAGNRRLIDAIHNDNQEIIKSLGKIEGILSSRR